MNHRRSALQGVRRLVVKIGSSLVTAQGKGLDEVAIAGWVAQIAELLRNGQTRDPFGMFGAANRAAERVRVMAETRFSHEERHAFKTLGIDPTRDLPQIKDHYKKLAKRLHPDVTGGDAASEERMKTVNQAYSFLMHRASDWT